MELPPSPSTPRRTPPRLDPFYLPPAALTCVTPPLLLRLPPLLPPLCRSACRPACRRNFRADAAWARAPKVYWEYCSPRVLVLEYLPGEAGRVGGWGGKYM